MATPEYTRLRASITDADCLRAFDYLCAHVGYSNRISIEAIASSLFGAGTDGNIRKARDIVELLRTEYGIAVCSSSGKSGRWLASSQAELDECLGDFVSRRNSLDATISALRRATIPVPAEVRRAPVMQPSLF